MTEAEAQELEVEAIEAIQGSNVIEAPPIPLVGKPQPQPSALEKVLAAANSALKNVGARSDNSSSLTAA